MIRHYAEPLKDGPMREHMQRTGVLQASSGPAPRPVLHTEVKRMTVEDAVVGRSSLSTAHALVDPYCFQLQKEVTITTVGYQMAGVSSRGLLAHGEDHHLSWLPLLLRFQNNAIILLSRKLLLPSCMPSHTSPSSRGKLWVSQCQSLSFD